MHIRQFSSVIIVEWKWSKISKSSCRLGKDGTEQEQRLRVCSFGSYPGRPRGGPSLAIELNPPDQDGNPTKKNGLFIRTIRDVDFYKKMLENPQIPKALEMLSKVNPAQDEEHMLDI